MKLAPNRMTLGSNTLIAINHPTLLSGMVAFWPMHEASGIRYDRNGPRDLQPQNAPGSAAGLLGVAADFDTTSSQDLHLNSSYPETSGDFAVSIWVKRTAGNFGVPWSAKQGTYTFLSDALTRFDVTSGGGGQRIDHQNTSLDGDWHHLLCQVVSDKMYFWVDNVAASTGQGGAIAGARIASDQWIIGDTDPAADFYFDGLIQLCGVWDRGLTDAERSDLYNSGAASDYPSF